MSFLAVRYGLAGAAMAVIAWAWRAPWPRRCSDYAHSVAIGILVHGFGLGGVWVALDRGLEAGVAALIMGSQPLLTVVMAIHLLQERISKTVMLGLLLGFGGVVLVIRHKLGTGVGSGFGLAVVCLGVIAITTGTLYQKRLCAHLNLMTATAVQLVSAAVMAAVLAWLISDRGIVWTPAVTGSMVWSVFVLSIGATVMFYGLFRRGAASRVASLLYLVPPITAVMAWAGFQEQLGAATLSGMALTCGGVALVMRGEAGSRRRATAER